MPKCPTYPAKWDTLTLQRRSSTDEGVQIARNFAEPGTDSSQKRMAIAWDCDRPAVYPQRCVGIYCPCTGAELLRSGLTPSCSTGWPGNLRRRGNADRRRRDLAALGKYRDTLIARVALGGATDAEIARRWCR